MSLRASVQRAAELECCITQVGSAYWELHMTEYIHRPAETELRQYMADHLGYDAESRDDVMSEIRRAIARSLADVLRETIERAPADARQTHTPHSL